MALLIEGVVAVRLVSQVEDGEQAKALLAQELTVDMDQAHQCLRGFAEAHRRQLSDVVRDLIERTISPKDLDPFTLSQG